MVQIDEALYEPCQSSNIGPAEDYSWQLRSRRTSVLAHWLTNWDLADQESNGGQPPLLKTS